MRFLNLCFLVCVAADRCDASDVLLFDDETFTCADGSATMPVKRLNDDYCDCADGYE